MSFLSELAGRVMGLIGGAGKAPTIDQIAVSGMVDNNLGAIDMLLTLLAEHGTVFAAFSPKNHEYKPDPKSATATKLVHDSYKQYVQGLDYRGKQMEDKSYLSSFTLALSQAKRDHDLIRGQLVKLFGVAKNAKISLEEVKTTQTIVLGYLSAIDEMTSWMTALLFMHGLPNSIRPLGLHVQMLNDAEAIGRVARLVQSLYSRTVSESILTEIETIKRNGNDVYIVTDGVAIDKYTDGHGFSDFAQVAIGGFTRSVPMIIGDFFITRARAKHDLNVQTQEWLKARVVQLNLQLMNTPETSPEYVTATRAIAYYNIQIAHLTQRINDYGTQ